MRRDGGSVFPARANTGDPNGPVGGLSANEIARALISMMARSTTCSNQRPDTLMQDRTSAHSTKSSCNARPDHTLGQERTSAGYLAMSALRHKADIAALTRKVRCNQKRKHEPRRNGTSIRSLRRRIARFNADPAKN